MQATEACTLHGMNMKLERCCRNLTARSLVPWKELGHALNIVCCMNTKSKALARLCGKSSLGADILEIILKLTAQALVYLCGCSKDRVVKYSGLQFGLLRTRLFSSLLQEQNSRLSCPYPQSIVL